MTTIKQPAERTHKQIIVSVWAKGTHRWGLVDAVKVHNSYRIAVRDIENLHHGVARGETFTVG